MFKKISTSYNLIKIAFKYIKRDWELFVYSILSLLSSLAIFVSFMSIGYFTGIFDQLANSTWVETDENTYNLIIVWITFLYYLIFSFITFFFNTAIITSVQRRNEWKDNKFGDWLRDSMKHLKAIFIWSFINALVTTILKILQEKFWEDSFIWSMIIWLVGWMWNILTFFSFPLMILNWLWTKDAIKESSSLFKKTWWERALISVWVWFMFFFFYLLAIIIWIWIIFSWFIITWIIFLVWSIVFLMIISWTCDTIIKTILLHYAKTWALPSWLEWETAINNMIKQKEL